MDDIPAWKFHDSASCHFLVDGSRRCLVFLDHFRVFTVVDRKTGSKKLAKGVNAIVYADLLPSLTRFNKICHPSQRPRWQVDKEAIGLSRVH